MFVVPSSQVGDDGAPGNHQPPAAGDDEAPLPLANDILNNWNASKVKSVFSGIRKFGKQASKRHHASVASQSGNEGVPDEQPRPDAFKRHWSKVEEGALVAGVAAHGTDYRAILQDERFSKDLRLRTADGLKVKWARLQRKRAGPAATGTPAIAEADQCKRRRTTDASPYDNIPLLLSASIIVLRNSGDDAAHSFRDSV